MAPKDELPAAHREFVDRFPKLAEAWERCGEAGRDGPLGERSVRLAKLAIAMGAVRKGAVRAAVRRARELGMSRDEIEHVVALLPGTIGFPETVTVYSWVQDVLGRRRRG